MEKIPGDAKDINSVFSHAEILLDPEFYACFYAHQPDAKLGGLEAVIAKNFIRKTQQLFEETGDKRTYLQH